MSSKASAPVPCPQCQLSDQVEKVSTIYMDAIGAGHLPTIRDPDKPQGETGASLTGIPRKELHTLVRKLAPPSANKKALTRLVNPDQMILSFSLFLLIFIVAMLRSQPDLWLPAAGILILFYALYLIKRAAIIQRFERELDAERASNQRVEAAIGIWMKLYYCGRDNGVFLPGEEELIPLDDMRSFLSQRGASPLPARTRMNRR